MQEHEDMRTQGHKDARAQGHEDMRTQGREDTRQSLKRWFWWKCRHELMKLLG